MTPGSPTCDGIESVTNPSLTPNAVPTSPTLCVTSWSPWPATTTLQSVVQGQIPREHRAVSIVQVPAVMKTVERSTTESGSLPAGGTALSPMPRLREAAVAAAFGTHAPSTAANFSSHRPTSSSRRCDDRIVNASPRTERLLTDDTVDPTASPDRARLLPQPCPHFSSLRPGAQSSRRRSMRYPRSGPETRTTMSTYRTATPQCVDRRAGDGAARHLRALGTDRADGARSPAASNDRFYPGSTTRVRMRSSSCASRT